MKTSLLGAVLLLLMAYEAGAQIPRIISHQGFLTNKNTGQPASGTYQIRFRIYTDSTGSTQLWTQLFPSVTVSKGVYNVNLAVASLSFNSSCFLQTEVNGEVLTPRTRLTSAPYAIRSDSTENVVTGKVVKSLNGLRDNITLTAGNNVTITPNGSTLTIASSGGGGGTFALPYTGSVSSTSPGLSVTNSGAGSALRGTASSSHAVYGSASGGGNAGVYGINSTGGYGLYGFGTALGVFGVAIGGATGKGVFGSGGGYGVHGNSSGAGVWGEGGSVGVVGTGTYGVRGTSADVTGSGLFGENTGSGVAIKGFSGNTNYTVWGENIGGGVGVRGSSATGTGVVGYTIGSTGRAGYFQVSNLSNNRNALEVESNGTGNVLYVNSTNASATSHSAIYVNKASTGDAIASYSVGGNGVSGYSSGSGRGISGFTNGSGYGVYGYTSGSAVAVGGYTTGSGRAGRFEVSNASNGVTALISYHNGSGHAVAGVSTGTGRGGHFEVNNSGSSAAALYGSTNGAGGSAGYFLSTNAANAAPAIYSRTSGSGSALQAVTLGSGSAATISVVNTGNSAPALSVTTTGTGLAAEFGGKVSVDVLQINGGSDLAEPFEIEAEGAEIEPGTIVIIDDEHPGQLMVSEREYDSRVAGVVSGAGGIKPGLTLQQDGILAGKSLVAMAGRVYCKADARNAEIKPGDLLTTSSHRGFAMKATDRDRSHGAVIGKAMSALKDGTGLVLVLVNLQ